MTCEIGAHYGQVQLPAIRTRPINREWPPGRAVFDRRTVHVHDLAASREEYPAAIPFQAGAAGAASQSGAPGIAWRTVLAAPLMRESEALGVIVLRRSEVSPFSEAQVAQLETFADQAVIAIENARLFEEVRAKTRDLEEALAQQTATAEVLKVISRSAFDLDAVLNSLTRSAVELCSSTYGAISLYRDGVLKFMAQTGCTPEFAELLWSHPARLDRKSATGRAALLRSVVLIPDVTEDDEYDYHGGEIIGNYRSMMAVPLLRNGELEGVFTLMRGEPGTFTPRQVELVQTFSDQAVIAIENVRLFDEVQARTRDVEEALKQQTATADVLKVISRSAFDLQTVLDTLAASAAGLIGANFAVMYLRRGEAITPDATFGCPPELIEFLAKNPQTPGRETVAGRVFLHGQVQTVPDVLEDPEYVYGDAPRLGNFRALLGVPLFRDGKVDGSFTLGRSQPGPFTQRQIEIVQTFADQAVIAIENVRLFDEVQARTKDLTEALQQQTATAEVLKVISRSAFDLQAVLQTLTNSARLLSGAASADVMMLDGDVLRIRAQSGCDPEFVRYMDAHPSRPGKETVSGRVMMTGEAAHIPDVLADADYDYGAGPEIGNYRAILGAPLIRDGKVDGRLFSDASASPAHLRRARSSSYRHSPTRR